MQPISARSFTNILYSDRSGVIDSSRTATYAGRERHSSARWLNLGYPQRAIRTHDFLFIRNFYPERWPAGAPQILHADNTGELYYMHGIDENGKFTGEAYHDIDDSPAKTYFMENMNNPYVAPYFRLAVGKRPAEELYDIKADPYCMKNLAGDNIYTETLKQLNNQLTDFLSITEDPRVVGPNPDVFENYQRFYVLRAFPKPEWAECK